MKAIIQRVSRARVLIDEKVNGEIKNGFLVLLGVHEEDTKEDADYLVRKISKLRVFSDADDKMNLDISQVNGSILSVSQFTLYAETKKGNRPSFVSAARPEISEPLYEYYNEEIRNLGITVETGIFGADMQVELVNDGPVTIEIDTRNK
jgi:D-tyrosyl-tRNA(Tyr) deacylase